MSETKTSAKHVVIFDRRPSDGGSIPPASTKFLRSKNLEHWIFEIGTIENSNAVYCSTFHFLLLSDLLISPIGSFDQRSEHLRKHL